MGQPFDGSLDDGVFADDASIFVIGSSFIKSNHKTGLQLNILFIYKSVAISIN